MPGFPGSDWINAHWNPDFLPNNMWVAATSNGIVAQNESLDPVIAFARENFGLNQVTFAFVTFDLWQ
jgi:hypothetical protein